VSLCIKEQEFITKSHRKKNTRKTNMRKKKNWNVVWTDKKRRLCKLQKKSTRYKSVEKLDNEE